MKCNGRIENCTDFGRSGSKYYAIPARRSGALCAFPHCSSAVLGSKVSTEID